MYEKNIFALFSRGHVYALNTNLPEGFLCFVDGNLIFRPSIPEKIKFAEVIDTESLKVGG